MHDLRCKLIVASMGPAKCQRLKEEGWAKAQRLLDTVRGRDLPKLFPKLDKKENETEEEKKLRYETHEKQKEADKQAKSDARSQLPIRLFFSFLRENLNTFHERERLKKSLSNCS